MQHLVLQIRHLRHIFDNTVPRSLVPHRTIPSFIPHCRSRTIQFYLPYQLGWLEREFYLTDRTKFDGVLFGVLFKAGDKSVSSTLVEFAGSVNDNTSSLKNSNDIKKLY
ncbi:hypothetical protein CU098_009422, partial [Rhizopus stolonifer]